MKGKRPEVACQIEWRVYKIEKNTNSRNNWTKLVIEQESN